MKLVAAIKLLPTQAQAKCLKATLERCNDACEWLSSQAWENKIFGQYALHKLAYSSTRARFDLSAQAVVRCIAKVADAYKLDRKTRRHFRKDAAQPYDDRIIRCMHNGTSVNLWTLAGRMVIPVVMGEHQKRLMSYRKGEVDLCLVRGKWILAATCDLPEADEINATDWLGVDFGIISLAVDSDGAIHSGVDVERIRDRLSRRKRGLQKRGTKAARRRLCKLSGKEARFRSHTNHTISKVIVQTAERTGRGIALEDLKGIRRRVTAQRSQRSRLHSWSFHQLRSFIAYKAKRCGVPVAYIDPRNTSRTCSCCGVIDKKSRPDQATFLCVSCGHSDSADLNAARNIRAKAAVTPPQVLTA
jgi:putative transposase